MNFIILNGRKSTEVAGLMIQSLPPVVKPPMRVQLDEVDGRDGDIITPLGYSGYDRTVKIGLRGVYDEDDIVEYFNSSGKVIFSNEPDKVYDYTIVESFSLDRLRKFREAEIVFHVQPYKHSIIDEKTVSAITLKNCAVPKLPFTPDLNVGINLTYADGTFTLNATYAYDIYIVNSNFYQIDEGILIEPGTYDIYLTVSGGSIQYGSIEFGICDRNATAGNIRYYAEQKIDGSSSGTVHLTITVTQQFTMNYVMICLWPSDNKIDDKYRFNCSNFAFTNFRIMAGTGAELVVTNRGNTEAAPKFSLIGAKECALKVNDGNSVSVSSDSAADFSIDVEKMNAYSGSTLKNRLCNGNYADLKLKPGRNVVTINGIVSSVEVSNYSRWI